MKNGPFENPKNLKARGRGVQGRATSTRPWTPLPRDSGIVFIDFTPAKDGTFAPARTAPSKSPQGLSLCYTDSESAADVRRLREVLYRRCF